MIADKLTSWGHYPSYQQTAHPSHWRSNLRDDLSSLVKSEGSTLAFGNGRSYGDSCLASSDHVLYTRPLDRFISVDWETGVIVAESGVTLEEVLTLAIPNGWFLTVTPGTKFVTLGGAVANDVHGKNHHVRGTFGCYVRRFALVRSEQALLICSQDENSDLFAATIGGLGLTGVIEWVELKLRPIKTSTIDLLTVRFGSLNKFFSLSKELDEKHEYTVAWIDCLAKGAASGRGVYMIGDHSESGELKIEKKRNKSMPFTPPISAINALTLRLFNTAYYHRHKPGRHKSMISYEPFFYPLDNILNWNRIYGPKGFQQYQCVIPEKNAESATLELLQIISSSGNGSFLAVLKRCGEIKSPGLLSFPMSGVTLALDFPQSNNLNNNLFQKLDLIVRQSGGRLYPAKDAHMAGKDFRAAYPDWEELESLRDPALSSRFWKRVTTQ